MRPSSGPRAAVSRRTLLALAGGLALPGARAQDGYPNRPIRIIVPFAPGGTIDSVARNVASQLGDSIGQRVIIDSKPGANGVMGTELVARAPGDGYTLLLVTGSFAANPSMYSKLSYDVIRDFTPITSMARALGLILVVHPSVPARTVAELVAHSKKPGVDLNYSSPGVGNTTHLAMELFRNRTGAKITHVPYKGSAPALQALLANEVQVEVMPPAIAMPHIRAGKMRVLACTSEKRLPDLPDVPTMGEAGVDLVFEGSWIGLFAPSSTPRPIVDKLYAELKQVLDRPAVKAAITENSSGYVSDARPPAEFARQVQADVQRFAEVIRIAGIQPE